MVNSENEIDLLRVESLVTGNPAAEVITETETPHQVRFDAGDGHDFHIRTQVTVHNPADHTQTERLSIAIADGDHATGRTLASTTREITLEPTQTRTIDVNTDSFRLADHRYEITVEPLGDAVTPIEVLETREFTRPASFVWDITPRGDLELTPQSGQPSIRVDGEDGTVAFPAGRAVSPGPMQVGEDDAPTLSESTATADPAAVIDSNDPASITFQAGDGVDAHDRTLVTLTNETDSTQGGDVTVSLLDREAAEVVATATVTVELVSGAETTEAVLDELVVLPDGEYEVSVTVPTDLTLTETRAEVRGAQYRWEQTDTGQLELVDHDGEPLVTYPIRGPGAVGFPTGVTAPEVTVETQRGDPTTDELAAGESLLYLSDGSTGAAGDLVRAHNDGGTILTQVVAALADAS